MLHQSLSLPLSSKSYLYIIPYLVGLNELIPYLIVRLSNVQILKLYSGDALG